MRLEPPTWESVYHVSLAVYDANGRVTHASDPFIEDDSAAVIDQRAVFATETVYDALGRVIATRRIEGLVIDVEADGDLHKTSPGGGDVLWSTSTAYDAQSRVVETTDRTGGVSENLYNLRGDLIQTRSQSLDENGDPRWIATRTTYDKLGRPVYSSDPYIEDGGDMPEAGVLGTYTQYDNLGREFKTTRVTGLIIGIATNDGVSASSLTDAGDELYSTETVYDSTGRVDHTVGAHGETTHYRYDEHGRQVAVIGPVVTVLFGNILAGVRHRTETVYDAQGRRWKSIDNVYVDDVDPDEVLSTTAARTTEFEYDAHVRVVKTTLHRPSPLADLVTTVGYDDFGRRISETDAMNRTKTFEYDDSGRLIAVELPAVFDADPTSITFEDMIQPRYEYAYDAMGNHVSIVDPRGNKTVFTYDAQGRQTSRTLPVGVISTGDATDFLEQKFYDDLGRLDYEVSFEGRVTQYVYSDEPGAGERLIAKNYFATVGDFEAFLLDAEADPPAEITTYVYDAFGRPKVVTQDTDGDLSSGGDQRVTEYEYDAQGRVTQVASDEGTINYDYDFHGRLTETATTNTVTQYGYDDLGRLTTVTTIKRFGDVLGTPEVAAYHFDLLGQLDLVISPNGVVADYHYDDVGRVDLLTHFIDADDDLWLDEAEVVIAQFAYTYDEAGQRLTANESFNTDNDGDFDDVTHVFTWTYDAINRLTQETHVGTGGALAGDDYTTTYKFDLVGNRREMTVVNTTDALQDRTVTYTYDENDRLLTEDSDYVTGDDATTEYSWGTAGEATYQTGKAWERGTETETTTYAYNLQGRMAQAVIVKGGVTTTLDYAYDASGIRVSQTETVGAAAAVVHDYLVDANNHTGYQQVLEEFIGEVLAKSYMIGLDILAQTNAGITPETLAFLYDAHGSTRALLTALAELAENADAGDAIQLFAYEAYGSTIAFSFANALTSVLYSGEQTDQKLGVQYLRARYYDASVGRFNSLDRFSGMFSIPLSLHKYLYTHASPINGVDPSGEVTLSDVLTRTAIGAIIINTTLTVLSGIRHGASLVTILGNVAHNLAVFGAIIGAVALSGPIAVASTVALIATAAIGIVDLYNNASNMDTIDWLILAGQVLTFMKFGGSVARSVRNSSTNSGEPALDVARPGSSGPLVDIRANANGTYTVRQGLSEIKVTIDGKAALLDVGFIFDEAAAMRPSAGLDLGQLAQSLKTFFQDKGIESIKMRTGSIINEKLQANFVEKVNSGRRYLGGRVTQDATQPGDVGANFTITWDTFP